jgi:hypothetical protein
MLRKTVLGALLILCAAAASFAQSRQDDPPQNPQSSNRAAGQQPAAPGSPEAEMLRRAAIRHAEELHKDTVERADEAAQLAGELRTAFEKSKSFAREDLKKFERLENLARKIRGSAGGSDDDEKLKDPPARLEAAVARLAELSDSLNDSVRKTSRLVVSAAVIERSNELIELIRHIRTFVQP